MNILRYLISGLTAVLLASGFSAAIAEERLYGSFIYNSEIPNALFFMDQIKNGDDFELRKALRNHEIDTIVLASPGGSVWAGLSMAGIIFDKDLRVYVPPTGLCASACSYMFFGGAERLSDGKLGVHQFASSDESRTANAVKTQAQSQFTVSEIIGFLNEFDTPRFVLERMFEDREMYWFNNDEIKMLNSKMFTLEQKNKEKISQYAASQPLQLKVIKTSEPKPSEKELVVLIQKRLNEIGCNAGAADGIWGKRSNAAAVRFAKKAGLPITNEKLISEKFFEELKKANVNFCPKPEPKPKPKPKVNKTQLYFVSEYIERCGLGNGKVDTNVVKGATSGNASVRYSRFGAHHYRIEIKSESEILIKNSRGVSRAWVRTSDGRKIITLGFKRPNNRKCTWSIR